MQAWMNQTVQETVKSGKDYKPKYRRFDEFYDSEEEFNNIFNKRKLIQKPKQLSLADKNRLLSKKGGN